MSALECGTVSFSWYGVRWTVDVVVDEPRDDGTIPMRTFVVAAVNERTGRTLTTEAAYAVIERQPAGTFEAKAAHWARRSMKYFEGKTVRIKSCADENESRGSRSPDTQTPNHREVKP